MFGFVVVILAVVALLTTTLWVVRRHVSALHRNAPDGVFISDISIGSRWLSHRVRYRQKEPPSG